MTEDERPLRLDAPREEALAHAARLVEEAWRSFDRYRPEEPPLDERVRRLLRAGSARRGRPRARGARRRRAHPGRVDRPAAAAVLRVHRVVRARDRRDRRPARAHVRHQPGGRRAGGHADRAPGRAVGERVRRVPGHDRGVHQRRDDQQRDRARGRAGAGAPGRAPRRASVASAWSSTARPRCTTPSPARSSCWGSARTTSATCRSTTAAASARRAGGGDRPRRSRAGVTPVAVVATAGTTLTGAIDRPRRDRRCLRASAACGSTWTAPTGCRRLRCRHATLFGGLERADSVLGRRAQVALPAEGMRGRPGARARDA